MKFIKAIYNREVHIFDAYLVKNFINMSNRTTMLILDFPLHELTFEVPWDAEDLIEKIYGTDDTEDIYEIIDGINRDGIETVGQQI